MPGRRRPGRRLVVGSPCDSGPRDSQDGVHLRRVAPDWKGASGSQQFSRINNTSALCLQKSAKRKVLANISVITEKLGRLLSWHQSQNGDELPLKEEQPLRAE